MWLADLKAYKVLGILPVKVGSSPAREGFDSLIVGSKTGLFGRIVQ